MRKQIHRFSAAFLLLGGLFFQGTATKAAVPVPNVNDVACAAIMCLYGRHHYVGESHVTGGQQALCQPATKAYFSIRRYNILWLFSVPPFFDPLWTAIARQRFLAECISADASGTDALYALEANAIYGTWFFDPGIL